MPSLLCEAGTRHQNSPRLFFPLLTEKLLQFKSCIFSSKFEIGQYLVAADFCQGALWSGPIEQTPQNKSHSEDVSARGCGTSLLCFLCFPEPGETVPRCDRCRPGYTGLNCNQCDKGYYNSDSICVRCKCNGNVDPALSPSICQPDSGECIGCLYHTTGFHCELCEEGYSRDLVGTNCTRKGKKCCSSQCQDSLCSCPKVGEGMLLIVHIGLDSSGLWGREENQIVVTCWCLLALKDGLELAL